MKTKNPLSALWLCFLFAAPAALSGEPPLIVAKSLSKTGVVGFPLLLEVKLSNLNNADLVTCPLVVRDSSLKPSSVVLHIKIPESKEFVEIESAQPYFGAIKEGGRTTLDPIVVKSMESISISFALSLDWKFDGTFVEIFHTPGEYSLYATYRCSDGGPVRLLQSDKIHVTFTDATAEDKKAWKDWRGQNNWWLVYSPLTTKKIRDNSIVASTADMLKRYPDSGYLPYFKLLRVAAILNDEKSNPLRVEAQQLIEQLKNLDFPFSEEVKTLPEIFSQNKPSVAIPIEQEIKPTVVMQPISEVQKSQIETTIKSFTVNLASVNIVAALELLSDDFRCGAWDKAQYRKKLEKEAAEVAQSGPIAITATPTRMEKSEGIVTAWVSFVNTWAQGTKSQVEEQCWRFVKVNEQWRILEIDRFVTGNKK